jgi:hypothetical protein
MTSRYADEGFGRWAAVIARRVGPATGIAALFTVVSGVYLFMTLHATDTSTGALVLRAGALAAVVAFVTGLVSRATGRRLARLTTVRAGAGHELAAPPSPEVLEEMAVLRRRAALSTRVTAALLGLTVLSMALFRYAPVL